MCIRNKVDSIVYLVAWPILQWDAERWGFEYFRNSGFNVIVLDLSQLLNGPALARQSAREEVAADYIFRISTYEEFQQRLKKLVISAIFIDYILGVADIDWKREKVFRLLHRWHARYFIIAAGIVPASCPPIQNPSTMSWISSRVKRLRSFSQVFDFVFRKIAIRFRRNEFLYGLPDKIFGCRSGFTNSFLRKYHLSDSRWVLTHSLDFDHYLQYIQDMQGHADDILEKQIVFIDEGLTAHCDWDILNISPLNGYRYSVAMESLFKWIEMRIDAKVVVAAHPRSSEETLKSIYPDRHIISGDTMNQVANSIMVIAHYSTAIGFAVIFKKPLMLVKTKEMHMHKYFNARVDEIAQELNIEPMVISEDCLKQQEFIIPIVSEEKYNNYAEKYVGVPTSDNRKLWEYVMGEIER